MKPSRGPGRALLVGVLCTLVALEGCGGEGDGGAADPEPVFTETVEDDDCTVLTLSDVSEATSVPETKLEQRRISGCLYAWDRGNVNLLSVRVHETVDQARAYHARFTEDISAAGIDEAQDRVQEELGRRREEGEMNETDQAVAGALVDAMPEEDISHQRWSEIGSEAAMDGRGSVRLRYGNVTIWLTGKTDGEDVIDPALAQELSRRIVANLDGMR